MLPQTKSYVFLNVYYRVILAKMVKKVMLVWSSCLSAPCPRALGAGQGAAAELGRGVNGTVDFTSDAGRSYQANFRKDSFSFFFFWPHSWCVEVPLARDRTHSRAAT